MGISDVRAGLEVVLANVAGLAAASGYPTEAIGAVPFAYVGFDDDAITGGARELHLHLLPIMVMVDRKAGNLKNQVVAVEALIEPVLAALRSNQDLGGLIEVARVQPIRVRSGVYTHAGTDYIGFVVDTEIKESFAATYS
jgi:hypothetical protein